jgi:hypothetical protein
MHTRGLSRWWVKLLLLTVSMTAVALPACNSSVPTPPEFAPPSVSPALAQASPGQKVKPKDNDDPLSPREKLAKRKTR